MKTADIKVGEEYAIGTTGNLSRYGGRYIKRGRVLETGVDRRTLGGARGYRGNLRTDGILMAMLHDSDPEKTEVVPPARVQMLWYEFETMRDEAQRKADEQQAAFEANHTAQLNRIRTFLPPGHAMPRTFPRSDNVSMTLKELADLLEHATMNGAQGR